MNKKILLFYTNICNETLIKIKNSIVSAVLARVLFSFVFQKCGSRIARSFGGSRRFDFQTFEKQ